MCPDRPIYTLEPETPGAGILVPNLPVFGYCKLCEPPGLDQAGITSTITAAA